MLAALLVAVLAASAQDAPAAAPAVAQVAPDAAAMQAEFEALQTEMGKAEDAFLASLPRDTDGNYAATEKDWARDPVASFFPKFLDLGKRAGVTETGASALLTAMGLAGRGPDRAAMQPQLRDIAQLMVDRFAESPEMERLASAFAGQRYSLGSAAAESLLRRTLEKAKDPAVKAAATFGLGEVLFDPEYVPDETSMTTNPRADTAPARALFESVQHDFPGSEPAERARNFLFQLDHLQVGMTAPDFTATDSDGQSFKLSDYRGKVVLLDFWGFW